MVLRIKNLRMGFSTIVKCNNSHMVFLDSPLHVDAVTDTCKLPWHKYLKRLYSKNSHPYNLPASLSLAVDYMKVATELMEGLGIFMREGISVLHCTEYL